MYINLFILQLLCFLNACNGSYDAANAIATYYKIRQTCPSIFSNRDPLSAQLQQCLSSQYYFHLPNTPKGYSVIYHCLSSPKASDYVFDEACKTFFMTIGWLINDIWEFLYNFNFRFPAARTWSLEWADHHLWYAERGFSSLAAAENRITENLFHVSSRSVAG